MSADWSCTVPEYMYTIESEIKTLKWWILRLMLDLLFFFIISRLNNACSLIFNLLIYEPNGIKDIPF